MASVSQLIKALSRTKTDYDTSPLLTENIWELPPWNPNITQGTLPRLKPVRGVEQVTQDKIDRLWQPSNINRLNRIAEQGLEVGGEHWYNTEPLRLAFIDELGEAEGDKAFGEFAKYLGATSPQTKVPANIKRASYFYTHPRHSLNPLDIPSVKDEFPVFPNITSEGKAVGYGAHTHKTQIPSLTLAQQGSLLNSLYAPKTSRFEANLLGNLQPVTVDMHNARSLGWGSNVDPKHYRYLEDFNVAQGTELGVDPAQWQSSLWMFDSPNTGVADSRLFMQIFNDRIALTSKNTGKTQKKVLSDFINKKAPLHSFALPIGGVGGLLESMGQFESLDDGFI